MAVEASRCDDSSLSGSREYKRRGAVAGELEAKSAPSPTLPCCAGEGAKRSAPHDPSDEGVRGSAPPPAGRGRLGGGYAFPHDKQRKDSPCSANGPAPANCATAAPTPSAVCGTSCVAVNWLATSSAGSIRWPAT